MDLDCDVIVIPADGKSTRTVYARHNGGKFKITIGPISEELEGNYSLLLTAKESIYGGSAHLLENAKTEISIIKRN